MSHAAIHPTAVISRLAELAPGVEVGPYAVVEGPSFIAEGVKIGAHAVVQPFVRLSRGVKVGAHAVLGGEPQDLTFKGQQTWLEVGEGTTLREGVTLHRSTREDRPTRLGAHCYFMAYSHAAHDVQVGDGVIVTQNALLAGHVQVGDGAVFGGAAGVHQFVRIGSRAMVGGLSKVTRDILPFTLADGRPALHYRLNAVGLRRAGVGGERYAVLEQALRLLREGHGLDGLPDTDELRALREFLAAPSKRGLSGFVQGKAEFEG